MERAHRQLLQAFMARGILDAKQVKAQVKLACETHNYNVEDSADPMMIVSMITTINTAIKDMQLEIKKAVNEDTGGSHYVLINLEESDITQLSSEFSVAECEYYKKLVERVVESEAGCVRETEALNLNTQLPETVKLTVTDTQRLLDKLLDDKWICYDAKDRHVSLSTRSLLEMESYIREQHPESVTDCNMCKRLCIKGQSCSECNVKMHWHCLKKFFKNEPQPRCPNPICKTDWNYQRGAGDAER